ncbi:MAG: hypothetical protein Q4D29_11265 [Lachnospiraceae bacterium]|nr:hypothetical protein [Lachnospiraceae bacterium]
MLLTKEIESIYSIASNDEWEFFPQIDKEKLTYYKSYDSSKHLRYILIDYNSDFNYFRNKLAELWDGDKIERYKGDILSAVYKCKDSEESLLEAIDLFNYMM